MAPSRQLWELYQMVWCLISRKVKVVGALTRQPELLGLTLVTSKFLLPSLFSPSLSPLLLRCRRCRRRCHLRHTRKPLFGPPSGNPALGQECTPFRAGRVLLLLLLLLQYVRQSLRLFYGFPTLLLRRKGRLRWEVP